MKKHLHTFREYVFAHKIISAIVIIVIVIIGYKVYSSYNNNSAITQYTGTTVSRSTIVSTVTGSGQVSASNEVELKSKSSGTIVSLNVTGGKEVKAGDLIAQLDSRSVSIDLENARIAMQKLVQPANTTTLLQAENSLASAQDNLTNDYGSALSAVTNTFVDLPTVIEGMKSALYSNGGFLTDQNLSQVSDELKTYRNQAGLNFDIAKAKYDSTQSHYKSITTAGATSSIESVAQETNAVLKTLAIALKDAKTVVDLIQNDGTYNVSGLSTFQTNVNSWTSKVNSNLTSVSNAISSLSTDKSSISEKTASLKDLKDGPDTLDVASQKLSLQQKQYAYDDTFIRAPFDGVIAKVSVKKMDDISSGVSVATLITKQKTATISLNEVDVSKIKNGDKVTLTFDAIEGLSITGTVSEIDGVGTVSQGVVTYNVTTVFDTQDDRVKSGMSVSAAIITDAKADVIAIPSAAVKSQGGSTYVDMWTGTTTAPTARAVEVGTSNDTLTEITSGLNEGEVVVTRTITAAAKAATPSILNAVGGNRSGAGATGGATRTVTR